MARTKEEPRVTDQGRSAEDDAKAIEIYQAIHRLVNPTNKEILALLAQLPPLDITPSAAEIIRELRGPLPGDPDAEPLPPK